MIKEVTMYQVICDGCGAVSTEGQMIVAWAERDYAVEEAKDSFDYIEHNDMHFCPDCWEWDEELDERKPKLKS